MDYLNNKNVVNILAKSKYFQYTLVTGFVFVVILFLYLPSIQRFHISSDTHNFDYTEGYKLEKRTFVSDTTTHEKNIYTYLNDINKFEDFEIMFTVSDVKGATPIDLRIDLYDPNNYDHPNQETNVILTPGMTKKTIVKTLNSGDIEVFRPKIRLFYISNSALKIENIHIRKKQNPLYTQFYYGGFIVVLLCVSILIFKDRNRLPVSKVVLKHSFIYILFFFFCSVVDNRFPTWYGDGFEYGMMVESFYNHASPEMAHEDVNSFQNNHPNTYQFFIDEINKTNFIESNNFMSNIGGYYTDLYNKQYSYHFWMYSLLNMPSKYISTVLPFGGDYIFTLTHFFLLLAFIIYMYKFCTVSDYCKFILVVAFILSPTIHYFKWSHSEFFISIFVYWSIILFYEKKYLWAAILSAVASTQNSVIILLPLFYISIELFNHKLFIEKKEFYHINKTKLVKFLITYLPVFILIAIPSYFYFKHYHVTSVIVANGFMDGKSSFLNRFFGVYFDLNQGIIIGAPLILITAIILIPIKLIYARKEKLDLFIIIVVLMQTIAVLKASNWNCGHSVILRYGVWIYSSLLAFVIFNLSEIKYKDLVGLLFITQFIVLVFNKHLIGKIDYISHNEVSKFVLNNFPTLYNPDPEIFAERTLGFEGVKAENSPIVYYGLDGKPKKGLIYIKNHDNNEHNWNNWVYKNY